MPYFKISSIFRYTTFCVRIERNTTRIDYNQDYLLIYVLCTGFLLPGERVYILPASPRF